MKKQDVPAQESSGRFDPFRVLDQDERYRHLDAYRSYLEVRNGEIDLDGHYHLSRREVFLKTLEANPVTAENACDRQGFHEHLEGSGVTEIDEATAWLVAVAKANEGEAYGVDLELKRFLRDKRFIRNRRIIYEDAAGTDVIQLYVFLEELYHSRILCEVCKACGFDLVIRRPRWQIRMLSRVIYHMPDSIRWTVILCSEIVGATAFKLFLDRCRVFASEPEVEMRLRSLITEIWRDELLHVAMLRARLGPVSIRAARLVFPFVVNSLVQAVPELLQLGGDRGEFLRRAREGIEIPRDIDWLKPDVAPAS